MIQKCELKNDRLASPPIYAKACSKYAMDLERSSHRILAFLMNLDRVEKKYS